MRSKHAAGCQETTGLRYPPLTEDPSLLLIILNDLRRADFRFVRVIAGVAERTSLAQEIPALIQFDVEFREPLTIDLGKRPLLVQSVFLRDKTLNVIQDRLIVGVMLHGGFLHADVIPRSGCDVMPTRHCGQPLPNQSTMARQPFQTPAHPAGRLSEII